MVFSKLGSAFPAILLLLSFSLTGLQASNLPKKERSAIMSKLVEYATGNSTNATTLYCISYNTWGLPIRLAGHEQAERFKILPDSLVEKNADIICLQETFHPELRAKLIAGLRASYYMHQDYSCNTKELGLITKDCYGGLMTLSKYPIVSEKFYKYPFEEGCSLIEKIGSKGFLFTTIDINGRYVNVINTHLYAGEDDKAEKHRYRQMKFMLKILKNLPEFDRYPTLLMGDINTTHPDVRLQSKRFAASEVYPLLTETECCFEDTAPVLSDQHFTYDGCKNYYINDIENRQKLDYCFFRNKGSQYYLKHHISKVLFNNNRLLSDHFGWASHFSLINEGIPAEKLLASE